MVISRSSIPQQISKPGVKKKSKVKKVLKGLGKGLFSPAAVAFEAVMPKEAGSATLFTDEELKEIKRKEKENEKSIKKYMGGSLKSYRGYGKARQGS